MVVVILVIWRAAKGQHRSSRRFFDADDREAAIDLAASRVMSGNLVWCDELTLKTSASYLDLLNQENYIARQHSLKKRVDEAVARKRRILKRLTPEKPKRPKSLIKHPKKEQSMPRPKYEKAFPDKQPVEIDSVHDGKSLMRVKATPRFIYKRKGANGEEEMIVLVGKEYLPIRKEGDVFLATWAVPAERAKIFNDAFEEMKAPPPSPEEKRRFLEIFEKAEEAIKDEISKLYQAP